MCLLGTGVIRHMKKRMCLITPVPKRHVIKKRGE